MGVKGKVKRVSGNLPKLRFHIRPLSLRDLPLPHFKYYPTFNCMKETLENILLGLPEISLVSNRCPSYEVGTPFASWLETSIGRVEEFPQ